MNSYLVFIPGWVLYLSIQKPLFECEFGITKCGRSAAGSVEASQAFGRGFESVARSNEKEAASAAFYFLA